MNIEFVWLLIVGQSLALCIWVTMAILRGREIERLRRANLLLRNERAIVEGELQSAQQWVKDLEEMHFGKLRSRS